MRAAKCESLARWRTRRFKRVYFGTWHSRPFRRPALTRSRRMRSSNTFRASGITSRSILKKCRCRTGIARSSLSGSPHIAEVRRLPVPGLKSATSCSPACVLLGDAPARGLVGGRAGGLRGGASIRARAPRPRNPVRRGSQRPLFAVAGVSPSIPGDRGRRSAGCSPFCTCIGIRTPGNANARRRSLRGPRSRSSPRAKS
jgi:hypothetical protein